MTGTAIKEDMREELVDFDFNDLSRGYLQARVFQEMIRDRKSDKFDFIR